MKPINVGLLGIGTVGSGTWDVLSRNASEIRPATSSTTTIVAESCAHQMRHALLLSSASMDSIGMPESLLAAARSRSSILAEPT